jgi:hypothetical protein
MQFGMGVGCNGGKIYLVALDVKNSMLKKALQEVGDQEHHDH